MSQKSADSVVVAPIDVYASELKWANTIGRHRKIAEFVMRSGKILNSLNIFLQQATILLDMTNLELWSEAGYDHMVLTYAPEMKLNRSHVEKVLQYNIIKQSLR